MNTAQQIEGPEHGERRCHGERTDYGMPVEAEGPDGQTLLVPGPSHTYSVSETYCGHCRQWIQTNGVFGRLRFMAEHKDGDCRAGEK